jgi:hypothetical protein
VEDVEDVEDVTEVEDVAEVTPASMFFFGNLARNCWFHNAVFFCLNLM